MSVPAADLADELRLVCRKAEQQPCPSDLTIEDCDTLRNRTIWLVRARWYVVAGSLAAVAVGASVFPEAASWNALAGLVAVLGAANAAWSWQARGGEEALCGHVLTFAFQQMLADFVLLAATVHFTGGIASPLVPMFVLHGVFSAVLLPKRHTAAILASAAGLLLLSAGLAHLVGWRPAWRFDDPAVAPTWIARALEVTFVVLATAGATWLGLHLARMVRQRHHRIAALAAELRQRNDALREVDEQRLRLLGVASHDLRSPLAAIESRLDLFLHGLVGEISPEQRDQLLMVKGRLAGLRTFIDDLLDLTAVESTGAARPESEAVDVAAQVRETVHEMQPLAEASGVHIAVVGAEGPWLVVAPRTRLALVWTNLLSNAIKYGQGRPVRVSVSAHDGAAHLEVHDDGLGIAPEDQPRLFTEFFRAKSARSSEIPGTGLGLAICRRVVQGLGGRIEVRSRPGDGTTFTVSLPLQSDDPAAAGPRAG